MHHDELRERGKAMEDLFFANVDKQLLEQLRAEQSGQACQIALAKASGIDNQQALNALSAAGIGPETYAAVSLIPLIYVAWADGRVSGPEKAAIAEAAHVNGIEAGTPAHDLLQSWLANQPGDQLFATWKAFVAGLTENLDEEGRVGLKQGVVSLAHDVAKSTGGLLGIGDPVSDQERVALTEVELAFD